jgi:hypothetical protein
LNREKEKHFKAIRRRKVGYEARNSREIFSLIQLKPNTQNQTNHLPGSIVAANNKDGRHRTIILCKSNIILMMSPS